MKWLEIIVLRTGGMVDQPIHLLKQVASSSLATGLKELSVCSHASIPGDFAIALIWETEETRPWGSDLAFELVQGLKRLGLVDHSIWIIQQNQAVKKGRDEDRGPRKRGIPAGSGRHHEKSSPGNEGTNDERY